MKSLLSKTEKSIIEVIARKEKRKPDDWLILHLQDEYLRVFKKPFNS